MKSGNVVVVGEQRANKLIFKLTRREASKEQQRSTTCQEESGTKCSALTL